MKLRRNDEKKMDTFYENVDEKRKGTKMHLQSDQKCL